MSSSSDILRGSIATIEFGLLTSEHVDTIAVVDITDASTKKSNLDGVCHKKLGPTDSNNPCSECAKSIDECEGHHGKIQLYQPVVGALWIPFIGKLASMFCTRCSRLLLPDKHLVRFKSMYCGNFKKKIGDMYALTLRNRICWFDEENPKSKPRLLSVKKSLKKGYCGTRQPDVWSIIKDEKVIIRPSFYIESREEFQKLPVITPRHLYEMFRGVSDRDHLLIGLDPKKAPLHGMFVFSFPVCPMIIRQHQSTENHLTKRMRLILKANQEAKRNIVPNLTLGLLREKDYNRQIQLKNTVIKNLERVQGPMSTKNTRSKKSVIPECLDSYLQLQRNVAGYVDSKLHEKLDREYGPELQGVKQRYIASSTDHGRMREGLGGKRVDKSGRGVISPDTNQEIDEVGLPKKMMMSFTYGEMCNMYNFHLLQTYINNGQFKHPGCNYIVRNGEHLRPDACQGGLQFGDMVHRHLIVGDPILVNRQPSLHKYSIMCHKIRLHENQTIKPHLCVMGAYGGDFDGDEMNLFLLPDPQARAEALELLAVSKNLIKDGKLIIGFVQHSVVGAYMLTSLSNNVSFTFNDMFQLLMQGLHDDLIDEALSKIPSDQKTFSGRDVVQFILPTYDGKNVLTKSSLNYCMLQLIQNDPKNHKLHTKRMGFIARLLKHYCAIHGVSISLRDYQTQELDEKIINQAKELESKANELSLLQSKKVRDPDNEDAIIKLLAGARDILGTNALTYLKTHPNASHNGFLNIIESGAKGGTTHITQTARRVGLQLNETSQRNTFRLNYYFRDDVSAYGHIERSFLNGLTSLEFFMHLVASRIAMIGATIKTRITGYLNRKIAKFVEDLQCYYDGSIRNANGQIIMFHYGFDTSMLCNFTFVITKLNVLQVISTYYFVEDPRNLQESISAFQEVSKLLILRYRLLKQNRITHSIALPTDINVLKRLLLIDRQRERNPQPISTIKVREAIRELWLMLVVDYHIPNTDLYEAAFFDCFSTRNLSLYGCLENEDSFRFTVKWISQRYIQQLCPAGSPKGHDAVQGLVEPSTQATLKLCHISGEAHSLVAGVPRLGEIVNLSKNIATPSLSVFILKKYETTFNPMESLIELYMETIVIDKYNQEEKEFKMDDDDDDTVNNDVILTLYLDKNQMIQRRLSPSKLKDKLIKTSYLLQRELCRCTITTSLVSSQKWWLTIKIDRDSKIIRSFSNSTEPLPLLSLQLYHALKKEKTLLAGIAGIKDFYKSYRTISTKDESNDGVIIEEERLVYETRGSNLMGVCLLPEVDIENTTTNDIHQIYQVYGIDAAKQAIEQQLYQTMIEIESSIPTRHVALIANTMCASGVLTPLTFAGMNSSKHCSSYVKLSTFERPLDSFMGAAVSGHVDDLSGVSESTMVGAQMKLGTNSNFKMISNMDLIPKCHERNIQTILRNAQKIEIPIPDISCFLNTEQKEGDIERTLLSFQIVKPSLSSALTGNPSSKRKLTSQLDVMNHWGKFDIDLDVPASPHQKTKKPKKKIHWDIDLDMPTSP